MTDSAGPTTPSPSRSSLAYLVMELLQGRSLADELREAGKLELQAATATGMFVGTPAYMASERLMNEPYDGRADVYSVGVMMFETLCGRLPFQSGSGAYWSAAVNRLRQQPASREFEPSLTSSCGGFRHPARG